MSEKADKFISQDILKISVDHAYDIAYKAGFRKGTLYALDTLKSGMEDENVNNISLHMIIDFIKLLEEKETN